MYLGIDYGKKRIGLACSEGELASPLTTISNTPQKFDLIKNEIKDESIECAIIGLPNSHLDSEIRQFGEELKQILNCQIIFIDEYNTTREAITNMIQSGKSKKARREDNTTAATILLQRYLDEKKLSPTNI